MRLHDEEVHAWVEGDPLKIAAVNQMTTEEYYNWKSAQHARAEPRT